MRKRFLVSCLFFSIFWLSFIVNRGLLIFLNWHYFYDVSLIGFIRGFLNGITTDFLVLAMIPNLWLLGLFLPARFFNKAWFSFVYSTFGFLAFLAINSLITLDNFYFPFAARHLSFELWILLLHNLVSPADVTSLFTLIYSFYLEILILFFIAINICALAWAVLWKKFVKPSLKEDSNLSLKYTFFSVLGHLSIFLLAIYVGFLPQSKKVASYHNEMDIKEATISINPVFAILGNRSTKAKSYNYLAGDTLDQNTLQPEVLKLLKTDEKFVFLNSDYPLLRKRLAANHPKDLNVVLFIVESLGKHFVDKKFADGQYLMPFLNDLINKSWYFDNFKANGSRTMEGVSAVIQCIPHLFFVDFSSLVLENKANFYKPVLEFNKRGYSTIFLHAAKYDSLLLHSRAKFIGFKKLLSRESYPNETPGSEWGLDDETIFHHVLEELNSTSSKFFIVVPTISTHPPLVIKNEAYKLPVFEDNTIFESFYQFDTHLKKFFIAAEKQAWFQNTIFIITADHSNYATKFSEASSIPLLIYRPKGPSNVFSNLGSQIDIIPTVFDLLDWEVEQSCPGKSLISKPLTNFTFFYSGLDYWLFDDYIYIANDDKLMPLIEDRLINKPQAEDLKRATRFYNAWFKTTANAIFKDKWVP